MKYKYKFSVIVPIYNLELFLNEALNSIVKQTIGFKENIQLILINDGSSDNSEKICKKFLDLYPENIIYKKQENKGVSTARNVGLNFASGKYINFFDGDDIWDLETFEKIFDFFEENQSKIDVVSCRQKYFESKKSVHALDFKYDDGNRIVSINENPEFIQMSVASTFIKSDIAKKFQFDKRLKYAEDAKYITQIILEKEKYGIFKDCIYHIRKRFDSSSSTQNKTLAVEAYTDTVDYYYEFLIDYSKKKYKKIIPYIEYALINAIKYRVGQEVPSSISDNIQKSYKSKLIKIIKQIDDEVIINTNKVVADTKLYLLKLKYEELLEKDLKLVNNIIYFKDKEIGEINGKNNLNIENIKLNKNKLILNGTIKMSNYFLFDHLYIDTIGKTYSINLLPANDKNRKSFCGDDMNKIKRFSTLIELDKKVTKFGFYCIYDENILIYRPNIIENTKRINLNKRCVRLKNKMITLSKNKILVVRRYSILKFIKKMILAKIK